MARRIPGDDGVHEGAVPFLDPAILELDALVWTELGAEDVERGVDAVACPDAARRFTIAVAVDILAAR